MKQYKVYSHPSGKTEAVKQGWSWPGFFFHCIWAMVKKLWLIGVGVLLGLLLLAAFAQGVGVNSGIEALGNLITIGVSVIFGIYGNSWREKNLTSRGFDHIDTVTAANAEGAVALYLKGRMKSANTAEM